MVIKVHDATLESKENKPIHILCEITYEEFLKGDGLGSFIRLVQKLTTPLFNVNGYQEIEKRMDADCRLILGEEAETGDGKIIIFNGKTNETSILEAKEVKPEDAEES